MTKVPQLIKAVSDLHLTVSSRFSNAPGLAFEVLKTKNFFWIYTELIDVDVEVISRSKTQEQETRKHICLSGTSEVQSGTFK